MTARLDRLAASLGMDLMDPADQRALETFSEGRELLKRLIEGRKEQGYTQTHFAELLGISQSAVAKMESGDRDPRLSTLIRYALGLDVVLGHTINGRPVRSQQNDSVLEESLISRVNTLLEDDAEPMDNVISMDDYRGLPVGPRTRIAN